MFRTILSMVVLVTGFAWTTSQAQPDQAQTPPDTSITPADSAATATTDTSLTTVVYYFHGNKRCMTCRKIEELAEQSLRTGFEAALADSSVQWRVVNFEEEENAHFAKEYKLFSQTLIVSRQANGEEIGWTNLDKIWQLVHSEDKFISYVQQAVAANMVMEPE